ncbi:MAG: hypothetical protein ABFC63_09275 [Thermoguttaceae bacterium]
MSDVVFTLKDVGRLCEATPQRIRAMIDEGKIPIPAGGLDAWNNEELGEAMKAIQNDDYCPPSPDPAVEKALGKVIELPHAEGDEKD